MARTAEVRTRIERILDETREIPRGWSRARWMAVAACSLPLFYMTAAVRVTRAEEARPALQTASQPEAAQAQPKPALPAPAPSRISVPGSGMGRRLVQKVEPVYPPEAIRAGVQGEVVLETVIGADGHVKSAQPISGNPLLAEAARAAAMQYVYRSQEGAEIGSTATVVFRLPAAAARRPSIQEPVVIYKREAQYSEEARKAGVNGEVELDLLVGEFGVPADIRVVKTSSPLLNDSAVEAVRQWRFKPAMLNGVPVERRATAAVSFNLLSGLPAPTAPAGQFSPPRVLYKPAPEYPKLALQIRQGGVVELRATIGVDGRVKDIKVLKGPPLLANAARAAVMRWVYKPATLDGVPVENEIPIPITFDLPDAAPPPPPEPEPASER